MKQRWQCQLYVFTVQVHNGKNTFKNQWSVLCVPVSCEMLFKHSFPVDFNGFFLPFQHSCNISTKSTPAATSVAPVSVAVYPKPSQVAGVAVLPSLHPQTGQRGVAVLPPLPAQPSSQTEDLPPPPAYKPVSTPPSKRKGSPPPPYSSPSANHRVQPVASALPAYKPLSPPKVAPKPAYILPNPEVHPAMDL